MPRYRVTLEIEVDAKNAGLAMETAQAFEFLPEVEPRVARVDLAGWVQADYEPAPEIDTEFWAHYVPFRM